MMDGLSRRTHWVVPQIRIRIHRLRLVLALLLLLLLEVEVEVVCPWGVMVASAMPVAPDWSTCAPPRGRDYVDCCTLPDLMAPGGPGVYTEWKEYLRRNPLPARPRVRPAAHLAASNRTYLRQLNRAYQLMSDLPRHDPRSHFQQLNLHCMYGSEGMEMQMGHPLQEYSVHYTWLFLPFHRMYTFFYERILAKLVGDDDFVLPFWNWDNQLPLQPFLPNVVPHFYRRPDEYPALYSANRDPRHLPGQPELLVDLDYDHVKARVYTDDPDELRATNNARLHHYIASRDAHFLSRPLRAGDPLVIEIDNFEINIHGAVHYFTGHPDREFLDMGLVFSAPRDPVFCSHHANVDRIWAVWQSMGGKDLDDPDFLDAPFFFYDENAELVRVTVADTLDHRPMMYDWQEVENPWVTYDPADSSTASTLSSSSSDVHPTSATASS